MDASYIIYTNVNLPHISVVGNMNLDTILSNINTAINTSSAAPDYSGYNLYCVKEVDGITHPTNTQNFAEGISKMFCDLKSAYTTFTGTTYATNQGIITSAINGLQVPALTYTAFSITNTDTVTQVWNKTFTGITSILAALNPSSANWSTLSLSSPTTLVGGFNSLIAYISALNTTVSGKQATIANFDNSANCLGGSNNDTIRTTVDLLRTYTCALPTFDGSDITWGCLTSQSTLTDSIQSIVNTTTSLVSNTVVSNGTGLTITTIGSCLGKRLNIDTTWAGLYKVAISSGDIASAGYLGNKVTSLDGSITIDSSTNPDKLDLSITNPVVTDKIKVNSSDATADYLSAKVQGANDPSGFGLNISVSVPNTNDKIILTPNIDIYSFFSNGLDYILGEPTLFAKFAQMVALSTDGGCTAASNLIVVLDGSDFDLTWTPSGSATSQNVKWRVNGVPIWNTTFVTPINPQTDVQADATIDNTFLKNQVVEFAIDSLCSGSGVNTSNSYEMINYVTTLSDFSYTAVSGVINVNQSILALDTVQYRLKDGASTILQNISATGSNPSGTFTAVAPGTYSVEWRFGTLVNGSTLYSDDPTQMNAWIVKTGVIVS